jgi:hypothetical protein
MYLRYIQKLDEADIIKFADLNADYYLLGSAAHQPFNFSILFIGLGKAIISMDGRTGNNGFVNVKTSQ